MKFTYIFSNKYKTSLYFNITSYKTQATKKKKKTVSILSVTTKHKFDFDDSILF